MNLENRLLRLLARKPYVPAGADDITKKLGLGQAQAGEVRRELRGLVRSGRVVRLPDKRFALPADEDLVAGYPVALRMEGEGPTGQQRYREADRAGAPASA